MSNEVLFLSVLILSQGVEPGQQNKVHGVKKILTSAIQRSKQNFLRDKIKLQYVLLYYAVA